MIMTAAHAEEFLVPVDVNQHPVYGMMIAYPMDLSTIKQRLENRFYRRLDAVKFDAKFIELNAQNFNESGSEIVKKARLISALITEFIDDSLCLDPMPIYGRMVENYIQFSDPADTEESRDDDELREVRRSARKKRRVCLLQSFFCALFHTIVDRDPAPSQRARTGSRMRATRRRRRAKAIHTVPEVGNAIVWNY